MNYKSNAQFKKIIKESIAQLIILHYSVFSKNVFCFRSQENCHGNQILHENEMKENRKEKT